jgi:hypothetical protein
MFPTATWPSRWAFVTRRLTKEGRRSVDEALICATYDRVHVISENRGNRQSCLAAHACSLAKTTSETSCRQISKVNIECLSPLEIIDLVGFGAPTLINSNPT